MSNSLKFGSEARESLLKGLNTVADAVAATLGPKGRNVAIERPDGPLVIHDGVTVARSIELKDPFENQGARLMVKTAQKTNDRAGDGTTTATILAQAIANEGLKQIAAGANPQTLKKGIEDALKVVLDELKKLAQEVKTDEELEQVATISSNDPELGKLIAEAIKKVGKAGAVSVEEGSRFETTTDFKEGLELDKGWVSPHFVTNTDTSEAVIEDGYILMTDQQISHDYQMIPFLENIMKDGKKPLVIIGSVLDDALSFLVLNKLKGLLDVVVVPPPAFGLQRVQQLEDIAALCGGVVITKDSGRELESVQIEELGRAGKVVADEDHTVILEGRGDPSLLKKRIKDLEAQIELSTTGYESDTKKLRLAKLIGGVAVISVGGVTDTEIKERKERIIDAVNATKAAIEEGIVAGGEMTLFGLSKGDGILAKALKEPFKRLITNAGYEYAEVLSEFANYTKTPPVDLKKGKLADLNLVFDVTDGTPKDAFASGIIDPVKVTRSALENAVSIATMLMTTEVIVVDERVNE